MFILYLILLNICIFHIFIFCVTGTWFYIMCLYVYTILDLYFVPHFVYAKRVYLNLIYASKPIYDGVILFRLACMNQRFKLKSRATFLVQLSMTYISCFTNEIAFNCIVERSTSGIINSRLPQMTESNPIFRLHIHSSQWLQVIGQWIIQKNGFLSVL